MIVYLFLFDWHNICLNTPWTSKWCPQSDPLQVPIWVSQPYLNTPWTCNRCPQSDRLPIPIKLTQHLFEHPMNVQKMSSKWSSTSSYLSVLTLFEHPMDVQDMSSKWSSTSSYLTGTKPVWTPHGRPKLSSKCLPFPIWLNQPCLNNTCLNTPWTSKVMSSNGRDRLPVSYLSVLTYLAEPPLFEHHKDVQKMSSKWSSTSSYLTDTTPVWTPHGRPKDVLKVIVYQFLFDCHKPCLNTPWTCKMMSSKWSSTSSYLTDTTCLNTPWTCKRCPQNDRLPVPIWLTQNQFETTWTSKWCPQSDPPQVPIWVSQPYLNTPWTCKRCPQSDRLPVPIWLTKHLLEHPMNVEKMSSKWSSTSSYLTNTKPVWTPQGHAKDVLEGIVYQFLFDLHNTCLNTPWKSKWCPQRDPLQVPIWVSQPYLNTP